MLRQLYLGQLDMELHHRYDASTSSETPFDIQKKVAAKYLVVQPLPEDRFLCAFTHILGGGYAAGTSQYMHIIQLLAHCQSLLCNGSVWHCTVGSSAMLTLGLSRSLILSVASMLALLVSTSVKA
jgi:Zn-dependent oligopeptidase